MKESLRQTPRVLVEKSIKIETGELVRFAQATCNDNPIFSDAEAAKKCGYRDIIAVPTFADYFHMNDEIIKELELDEQRLTLLSQSIDWFKPLFAGDVVEVTTTLKESTDIKAEKRSHVQFSIETKVDRKGVPVLESLRVFYYDSTSSR